MKTLFPDFFTLEQVLRSGVLPAEWLNVAVVSSGGFGGSPCVVEWPKALPKKIQETLIGRGATIVKSHLGEAEPLTNVLAVIPCRAASTHEASAGIPSALFELPTEAAQEELARELLRLGADRQRLANVGNRTYLIVENPPYYSLLRGNEGGVRVYSERKPGVWLQWGFEHPLEAFLAPAEGTILVLAAPREWQILPREAFKELYTLATFTVSAAAPTPQTPQSPAVFEVALRLVPSHTNSAAELWVLPQEAFSEFESFLATADQSLTEELRFAIVTDAVGRASLLIRNKNATAPMPALSWLTAVGYATTQKIPNLMIPVGQRFTPQIRRDQLRRLLADDPDRLVLVSAAGAGPHLIQSVSTTAFAPLGEYVQYRMVADEASLTVWQQKIEFDFDSFICVAGNPGANPKETRPQTTKPTTSKKATRTKPEAISTTPPIPETPTTNPTVGMTPPQEFSVTTTVPLGVEELRERRTELEKQFLAIDGGLDAAGKQLLWPRLARINQQLNASDEVALAWLNAIWTQPELDSETLLAEWREAALGTAPNALTVERIRTLLQQRNPTPIELRSFALQLMVPVGSPTAALFTPQLGAIQHYFAEHEHLLPVRLNWLLARRLAEHSGQDVLGLARVRDRLLHRLLEDGLRPELDLPGFLRFASDEDSDQVRVVQDQAGQVLTHVERWMDDGLKHFSPTTLTARPEIRATLGYFQFMKSFMYAKLGLPSQAEHLRLLARQNLTIAQPPMPKGNEKIEPYVAYLTQGVLMPALDYRVAQALDGQPARGPLPEQVLSAMEAITRQVPRTGAGATSNPYGMAVYIIRRFRDVSQILEPQEKLEPYAYWTYQGDPFKQSLLELQQFREPDLLRNRVLSLWKPARGANPSSEHTFLLLSAALPLATRVGEKFAEELIVALPQTLTIEAASRVTEDDAIRKQAQLLERGIQLAGLYDRADLLQPLIEHFCMLLRSLAPDPRAEWVRIVTTQSIRVLRKLGLQEQIHRILQATQSEQVTVPELLAQRSQWHARGNDYAQLLTTQIYLAGAWLATGSTSQAGPILDLAEAELQQPLESMTLTKYVPILSAFVRALGQARAEYSIPRLTSLFGKLSGSRVKNSFTSAPYYSRFHLQIVDDVVLALTGDEFVLTAGVQQWLQEDELLIRRRIHQDMRQQMARNGPAAAAPRQTLR
ncbi:MAG: hypothetical protein ACRCZF_12240 [Gemmataceae bacterium]